MASVGQVYYDVLPNLDGFAAKVASGLGKAKPIKIPVESDTKAAEASAKRLTSVQTREAQLSSRQRMALIQRDAIAENRFRDRAIQSTRRASAQKMALIQRDAIAENRLRDRAIATNERAAARQIAAQQRVNASQQKASAAAAAQQKAARAGAANSVGNGLLVGGAATIAALGGIVKVTADFDKAVSNVASTGADASASIGRLRQEAIKYGADTAFSATEAANAQAELIKANVSVTDTINGGLKGALDLAAAGSLGVADAAGIMGTAMSQFKIPGTDASHVADLLAAAAGKAQGEVGDFAEALKYVGPLANSAGVSIEETTGVLAEFANQGILGSQAGTSLRGIFLGLTAPVGAGAKAIEKYGINVRDAQGNFIGLEGAAGELQKRLGGLSRAQRDAALSAIFGRNSLTAATILYEGGAEGVRTMVDAVNDLGYAGRTAATKMDNLAGDVEQLKGALDSAFISSGGGGTQFLRGLAQDATSAIDSFNRLSPATQQSAFQLAAVVGGTALAAGGLLKVATGGAGAIATLSSIGAIGPGAAAGLTAVGSAGLIAAAALVAVAAGNGALDALGSKGKTADELATSLRDLATGAGDVNAVFTKSNWADQIQAALSFGVSPADDLSHALAGLATTQDTAIGKFALWREKITPGTQSLEAAQKQVSGIDAALADMVSSGHGDQASAALERLGISVEDQNRFLPKYTGLLNEAASASGSAASSLRSSEIAFKNQGAAASTSAGGMTLAQIAAKRAADEFANMATKALAAATAQVALSGGAIAVEAAMDAAAASAKENGRSLDINTEKGRNNQTALNNLVTATNQQSQAMADQGKSASDVAAANERAKSSYVRSAVAMGQHEKAARKDADALFKLPAKVATQVVVSGAKVSRKEATDLNRALKGIPKEQRSRIITIANTKGAKEAAREIAKVKNKSVIAKATGKGVNTVREIDGAIKKLKSKAVQAQARAAGKGAVDSLHGAIERLKSKRVQVTANASGYGSLSSLQSAIGAIRGKTVFVDVKRRAAGRGAGAGPYTGGLITPGGVMFRSEGGPVWGAGTATSDSIPAMLSNGEYVIKAASVLKLGIDRLQYMNHKGALPGFAAGGHVPNPRSNIVKRAGGGPIGVAGSAAPARVNGRPLILNIDMGDLGVRRLVTEIVEDRDEYTASIGRMR